MPGRPIDLSRYIFGQDIFKQLEGLRGTQGQSTYLTPEQMSNLMRQLTQPALDTLSRQYGEQSRGLASNYASRGQLFGGSLTGAQSRLGADYNQNIANLFSNVGGQLGTLDLQLGAQRQAQSRQLLQSLFEQILGGEYGLTQARAQKKGGGFMGGLLGLGGALLGNPGLFGSGGS